MPITRMIDVGPALEILNGNTHDNRGPHLDDVLLLPASSSVCPPRSDSTRDYKNITLNIPIISAAMDTVTESEMAIALAQAGGIGVIHRNMTIERQCENVLRVKRFEAGMVIDPVTTTPETSIGDLLNLKSEYGFSGLPVLENKKLVGIITNRDIRFVQDHAEKVGSLMTKDLVTVPIDIDPDEAKRLMHKHRIEKLLVVDGEKCIGLMTVRDIERNLNHPDSCKDNREGFESQQQQEPAQEASKEQWPLAKQELMPSSSILPMDIHLELLKQLHPSENLLDLMLTSSLAT